MADLPIIVTAAGRAALVNAAHNGTAPVTIASVGVSPTAITATTATAGLPGEIKRIATISGDVVAADTIHLIVRDDGAQAYSIRSFALYLADGTLFAAYGQAGVIIEKSALSVLLLAIDVRFADVAATSLTFGNTNFLNPPATELTDGVGRFASDAEAKAGTSLTRLLSPRRAKDAVLSWLGYVPADSGGQLFSGDIGVVKSGNPMLLINSVGAVILKLVALADKTIALYRNDGTTEVPVFSTASQTGPFAVHMPITRQGNAVWDAGNDGAGSGCDADLLDGQQGSWYADIASRLGYVPANSGGQLFSGDIGVVKSGNPMLLINSVGAVILKLVALADKTIALYRNDGTTEVPVFSTASQTGPFAVHMPITRQGNAVWDAGNDGAGSGCDADLLDGQQGSWYADIISRLGFTPANVGGQNFVGDIGVVKAGSPTLTIHSVGAVIGKFAAQADGNIVLYRNAGASDLAVWVADKDRFNVQSPLTRQGNAVWDAGNDGAGSGCDADLLDGQQGGWYADIASRLGFTPANKAGDTFTGPVEISQNGEASLKLNSGGAVVVRLAAQPDGNVVLYRNGGGGDAPIFSVNSQTGPFDVRMPMARNGNTVWDAGNDGAGSGSDADMLDGQQGNWYADIAARLGFTPANKAGQIFGGPIGPEAGFRMVFSDGNPGIQFTGDGKTSIFYNRATRFFTFYIDGNGVFDIDASGNARLRGTFTQNVSNLG